MTNNEDIILFEELFKKSPEIKYPKQEEIISGTIIKIEKKNILVNVNDQFTWLVVNKEVGNTVDINSLEPEQAIEVMVLWDSIERWLLILSLKRANQIKNLSNLSKYNESSEIISVKPTEANKWWLLVDIDWLKWFIPVSQLTPIHYPRVEWANPEKILEHLNNLIGKNFKVKVINVGKDWKKIIFSEKAAIELDREKALKNLKQWDIVEWVISGILSYWLFVTFSWLEWLVHVSEIDWWHVNNPSKFAKVWMRIKVKVIWLDNEKISLSIKRLKENPWDILARKYKLGDCVTALISRISKFWAFMDLDWWIQWLIHLSEISHWVVKDIRDHVKVWEEVTAKIINFEPKKKRIWLSLKALQKSPKKAFKKSNKKWEEDKIDEEVATFKKGKKDNQPKNPLLKWNKTKEEIKNNTTKNTKKLEPKKEEDKKKKEALPNPLLQKKETKSPETKEVKTTENKKIEPTKTKKQDEKIETKNTKTKEETEKK